MYWVGHLISIAGSQMQLWALYWHLRTLSDQPMVISGIGLARFLPVILFSLIAGVAADRFNRRKMAILTQLALGLVAMVLGLSTWLGSATIWMLFGLMAVQSVAVAFDSPARQALIPSLVPREDLPNAYSLNSIASKVGGILGPAISGLVIAYMGLQWAYWINAISYLAVIAALIAMGDVPYVVEKKSIESAGDIQRYPGRDRIYKKLPHHPVRDDPGFLWHFLFISEYAVALCGAGYPACWADPIWLVVCLPIHRYPVYGIIPFPKNEPPPSGNVDFRFCWHVRSGNDPVWAFHFLLVDHAGTHPDRSF